jgi:hypothetical protein
MPPKRSDARRTLRTVTVKPSFHPNVTMAIRVRRLARPRRIHGRGEGKKDSRRLSATARAT